jgi:hypothetical protein
MKTATSKEVAVLLYGEAVIIIHIHEVMMMIVSYA